MIQLFAVLVLMMSSSVLAVQIPLPVGAVTIDIPSEFTELSREEIETKYGRTSKLPLTAFGNERRTVSVAITWSEFKGPPLTQEQMPKLKAFLESTMNKSISNLTWISSKVTQISGHDWVRQELIIPAADTNIHNVIYSTDLKGNMVAVSFNATVAEFERYKTFLQNSVPTLAEKSGT